MTRRELNELMDEQLVALLESHYSGHRLIAKGLNLSGKVFDGAELHQAELSDCDLSGARLRGVDLSSSSVARSSFAGADMQSIDLVKANWSRCNLHTARLVEGNLIRADFFHLDLQGADLTRSDLRAASFFHSDLRDGVLRDVVLSRTSFVDCHLAGLDLRGASGTVSEYPINVGTPEEPRVIAGDEALAWFRAAGADVSWFVPEPL